MNVNTPPSFGFASIGATMQPIIANMITAALPTITSCLSEAWGEINFLKISIENIVEAALSIAASELTTAPRRAANINPRRPQPSGITLLMRSPNAESYLYPKSVLAKLSSPFWDAYFAFHASTSAFAPCPSAEVLCFAQPLSYLK